jgi:hypothetical protein
MPLLVKTEEPTLPLHVDNWLQVSPLPLRQSPDQSLNRDTSD